MECADPVNLFVCFNECVQRKTVELYDCSKVNKSALRAVEGIARRCCIFLNLFIYLFSEIILRAWDMIFRMGVVVRATTSLFRLSICTSTSIKVHFLTLSDVVADASRRASASAAEI